jgi:hypothetical protein
VKRRKKLHVGLRRHHQVSVSHDLYAVLGAESRARGVTMSAIVNAACADLPEPARCETCGAVKP